MLKLFGLGALAAVAVAVMSFGSLSSAPSASADSTGIVAVQCRLLAGFDFTDLAGPVTFNPCTDDFNAGYARELALQIGNEDSTLSASDFDSFEGYDDNQLSDACTAAANAAAPAGLGCAMLVFGFFNDGEPVTFDAESGLTTLQSPGTTQFVCNTDVPAAEVVGTSDIVADTDCVDVVSTTYDGVVAVHVVNGNVGTGASRGDTKVVTFSQESVEQSASLNIVGSPSDVVLTLIEATIGTSGSVANSSTCATSVDVTDAVSPPNSTLAYAQIFDQDDRVLTMVLVAMSVQPPADNPGIARLGLGDPVEEITGTTTLSIAPSTEGAPIAFYRVVCGGSGTGETSIEVVIDADADGSFDDDTSTQDLTVVGAPSSVTLTAAPSEIACDGTATSTVTAVVADSAGNPVADGTDVNFSVVALGTANPINTVTTGGQATSVITPLSNASAGVTVIVTAGDSSTATVVQASTRVDCALPIETQPSPVPTAVGTVTPPDTGTGGFADQDGGFLSLWTLVALTIGGSVLVAGGMVTRRAAK